VLGAFGADRADDGLLEPARPLGLDQLATERAEQRLCDRGHAKRAQATQ